MFGPSKQPREKTTVANGEERRYYVMPFVPSRAAVQTYLGFHEGVDVKPPSFRGRPSYPVRVESGKGVAIVDSPWVNIYPAFAFDAGIICGIVAVSIIFGSSLPLMLLVVAVPVLAFMTWVTYINWLFTAMVVKENSVTFFTGFFVTKYKTVQGADLNGVDVQPLGDKLLAQVVAKFLDLSYVRVELASSDGQSKKHQLTHFTLRGIRNGEGVDRLVTDLQSKWERSITESAESERQSANYLASIDDKLNPAMMQQFGRAYVAVSNRDARLLRELIDQNNVMIPLLQTLAKTAAPGDRTPPTAKIPLKPDTAPTVQPPPGDLNNT